MKRGERKTAGVVSGRKTIKKDRPHAGLNEGEPFRTALFITVGYNSATERTRKGGKQKRLDIEGEAEGKGGCRT